MDIGVEEGEQEDEVEFEDDDPNDDIIEDASSYDEEQVNELEVTATGDITGCSIFGGSILRSMC